MTTLLWLISVCDSCYVVTCSRCWIKLAFSVKTNTKLIFSYRIHMRFRAVFNLHYSVLTWTLKPDRHYFDRSYSQNINHLTVLIILIASQFSFSSSSHCRWHTFKRAIVTLNPTAETFWTLRSFESKPCLFGDVCWKLESHFWTRFMQMPLLNTVWYIGHSISRNWLNLDCC